MSNLRTSSHLAEQIKSLTVNEQQQYVAAMQNQMMQQAANAIENEIDNEMNRMNNLTDLDLQKLRKQRVLDMQRRAEQKEKWKRTGHGTFDEIRDERQFFSEAKQSERVIVLFYVEGNRWCDVLKSMMEKLAYKHYETRFLKMDAANAPIVVQQFNIWMMPTLVLCKNKKVDRQIPGLDAFGPNASGMVKLEVVETVLYDMGFLEEVLLTNQNEMDSLRDAFGTVADSDDDSELLDL